ncbi:PEP-CTERM sorting domain-containing protein [Lusitaniella coriacea LEGE 07157]|uniref:PEP-CTERM sorting domain-containing protein n=1 Tax=Lusitaniella coriacea LEGE 07157 TaxID=945747 RepID=A0A8J7DW42_9CYAN|nr:PEP-CTERM sorting domain-containing protein [Lusitaniella coriacea]MBE9116244.1 PEP-CTERM sorting domain-containing protein [Lusitaniella coriacea LEGE 07157]
MPISKPWQKLPLATTIGVLISVGMAVNPANAVTLVSGNSSIEFDEEEARTQRWEIDGINNLFQGLFFFNIGNDANRAETSFADLDLVQLTTTQSTALAVYSGFGFDISLNLELVGGQLGSGTSDFYETITITNRDARDRAVSLFAYTDFDLNNAFSNDTTQISGNTAQQTTPEGFTATVEVNPFPDGFEISEFDDLRDDLTDDSRTVLNNFGGPLLDADGTFAFAWNFLLGTDEPLSFSQHKQIQSPPTSPPVSVPEPTSILGLLIGGFLGASAMRQRK